MDNWNVFLGGVAVTVIALYFSPTIEDYFKGLSANDPDQFYRLKNKYIKGLYTLTDKHDIQEYILKHSSMLTVSSLLKSYGSTPLPTPPNTSSFTSPIQSPIPSTTSSPNTKSTSPALLASPSTFHDLSFDTKFFPSQLQLDILIHNITTVLIESSNISTIATLSSITPTPFPSQSQFPSPQLIQPAVQQYFQSSQFINLSIGNETLGNIHKLYLLALRLDNNPDFKLQAFYDLYSDSTLNSNNNSNATLSKPVELPLQLTPEKIIWTPSSPDDSFLISQDDKLDGNSELNILHQRHASNNSSSSSSSPSLETNSTSQILLPQSISTDSLHTQQEIAYPSIFNTITELYDITTLSILFDAIKKCKVEHTIPFHESCLEILWNTAPFFPKIKTTSVLIDERSNQSTSSPTTPTTPTTPQPQSNENNSNNSNIPSPSSPTDLSLEQQIHLPYAQISDKWGDLGFQGRDPCTDFRGCGLLGLLVLTAFCVIYPEDYITYIKAHQERGISIYGLAITSINITATLCEYTRDHILTPLYFQYGSSFLTFVKVHRVVLRILYNEWNKRSGKYNLGLQLAHQNTQKHRDITQFTKGLTIMDFPHVYKDILILFKKQIYQNEISLDFDPQYDSLKTV